MAAVAEAAVKCVALDRRLSTAVLAHILAHLDQASHAAARRTSRACARAENAAHGSLAHLECSSADENASFWRMRPITACLNINVGTFAHYHVAAAFWSRLSALAIRRRKGDSAHINLSALTHWTNLTHIHLFGLKAHGVENLLQVRSLHSSLALQDRLPPNVVSYRVDAAVWDIKFRHAAAQLEVLDIRRSSLHIDANSQLAEMFPKLRHFRLSFVEFEPGALAQLVSLTTLACNVHDSSASIVTISELPSLTDLTLTLGKMSEAAERALCRIARRLVRCSLIHAGVHEVRLERIFAESSIRTLVFEDFFFLGDEFARTLARMPRLEDLRISNSNVDETGSSALARLQLPQVQTLSLWGVDDALLRLARACPNVRVVSLHPTPERDPTCCCHGGRIA